MADDTTITNSVARELRAGPQSRIALRDWIGHAWSKGGMSLQAFKVVHDAAEFHGFNKYRFPEDAISYAIEAAEALGL